MNAAFAHKQKEHKTYYRAARTGSLKRRHRPALQPRPAQQVAELVVALAHLRPHHLRRESPAVLELQHAVSGALLDIVLADVALRIDVEPAGGRADQCAVGKPGLR